MNKLRAKFGAHPGMHKPRENDLQPWLRVLEEIPPTLFPGTSFEMEKSPLRGILAPSTLPILRDRASQDARLQLPKQTLWWQSLGAHGQDRGSKPGVGNLESLHPRDPRLGHC